MLFWTPARLAVAVAAAVGMLVMLIEGLFQIHWLAHLPCPFFHGGCESVATSSFAYPLGLASGLLYAAQFGVIGAVVQVRGRAGALATSIVSLLAAAVLTRRVADMITLGAACAWCWLAWVLALVAFILSVRTVLATTPARAES